MAAVIEISPGPNFLLLTRSVPVFGKSGAMANVAGFCCAYIMHGALAVYGISAALATEPMLLIIIQLAGACYLMFLGVKSFISSRETSHENISTLELIAQPVDILLTPTANSLVMKNTGVSMPGRASIALSCSGSVLDTAIDIVLDGKSGQTRREGLFTCFRDGVLISAINPKISLFYMAAFPQFIQASTDRVASSFLLVFAHMTICLFWAALVAVVLEYALRKAGSQCLVDRLDRFSAVALIGLSLAFFSSVVRAF